MTKHQLTSKLQQILEHARTAVLATTDADGTPHMRWMTPAMLRNRPGMLYCVTGQDFAKVVQIMGQPRVEWMFQTMSLNEVINIRGRMEVVDNPSLRGEILEDIGKYLHAFWKACEGPECIILETVIQEAVFHLPLQGTKEVIHF